MTNDCTGTSGIALAAADGEIARLAARAIALLLSERDTGRQALELRLRLMCDAFLSEREETRHAMLLRLRQDGIPAVDIVDHVIPEVARFMGRRWADDDISFAEVSIGASRLQEAVRSLALTAARQDFGASAGNAGDAAPHGRILLVIPRPEHHTLGIFVVADQLKRLGYRADVAIGKHPRQIVELMRKSRYRMVGITASGRRTLASTRELVDTLRASVVRVPPIVLGGSIVAGGGDLRRLTGADHVAEDVCAALRVCGLSSLEEDLAQVAPRVCRDREGEPERVVSA